MGTSSQWQLAREAAERYEQILLHDVDEIHSLLAEASFKRSR